MTGGSRLKTLASSSLVLAASSVTSSGYCPVRIGKPHYVALLTIPNRRPSPL
jgi:hypothetical protein